MARFLLKGAKADIAKKSYDAAFTKLQRAETEDPSLAEAAYWLGIVLEARDDPKGALAAYRRFVAATAAKGKNAASKDEVALAKRASDRIDAIAAGEVERRKLDDAFVEAALTFARSSLTKDPILAAVALRHVVDLRPEHAEARKLLARLGAPAVKAPAASSSAPSAPGGPGAMTAPVPTVANLRAIRAWKDLLKDGVFTTNDDWVFGSDGVLSVQHHGGMLRNPASRLDTLPSYALEVECRVVEAFQGIHGLGFGFAFQEDGGRRFYALFVSGNDVNLIWSEGNEDGTVLKSRLPDVGAGGWFRLGVLVRGLTIQVFVNDERIGQHEDTRRKSLVGEPTIFVQNCRGDIRNFRLGTPP
ncbi:MAG: tetratricopeptide repeat protein [Planctomycetota bacterium]